MRVGSTAIAGAQERTYRIFVEELPPVASQNGAAAVRVLTKMGVPIFIRPAKETAAADLRDLSMRSGSLHFTVANGGTVHFVPQKVVVRAQGAGGAALFERDLQAWYILAGGRRDFSLAMPAADCAGVARLAVEVEFGSTVLRETLQTPGGACGS